MKDSLFLKKMWTSIRLNEGMIVVEVENADKRIFFGRSLIKGCLIMDIFPSNKRGKDDAKRIMKYLTSAKNEKRTICFEYHSIDNGEYFPVIAFAEYQEEVLYLHATILHSQDYQNIYENRELSGKGEAYTSNSPSENTPNNIPASLYVNDLERRAKILNITMETMGAYTWFYEPEIDKVNFGEGSDKIGRDASLYNSLGKFLSFVHPDDRQLFEDSIQKVIHNENDVWNVEYRANLNNSENYEWWQTRGMIERIPHGDTYYTYMFGMTINIEKHKRTELTLLHNREELNHLVRQNEMILNNTNSGLAFITADYITQWENVSTCLKVPFEAYKKGEFCYASAQGRTTPCDNCLMRRAFESCQMEQQKVIIGDKVVEIFATPVFKEDKTIEGIVIRVDDITEREQMIEDLRHAVQSDKLKSAFLANMSHEIRTPLNAIIGFSELLMSATDEDEREEFIRIINNNNELLLKLINDILDLSKIESGAVELKYEEFDFSSYFEEVATSMRQRMTNANVKIIITNPYPSCIVRLDKNRVAQILINYITNAIKYTKEGAIEIGYEMVEKGVRIYVKDTGIGIQEEKKHKVFMRFEKLDEFAQGTGLGLSICKAIAEAMKGSTGFDSKFGKGSVFWAVIPCETSVI